MKKYQSVRGEACALLSSTKATSHTLTSASRRAAARLLDARAGGLDHAVDAPVAREIGAQPPQRACQQRKQHREERIADSGPIVHGGRTAIGRSGRAPEKSGVAGFGGIVGAHPNLEFALCPSAGLAGTFARPLTPG